MNTEFAPLFQLGRAERLQLVDDLWDSIAKEEPALPVPEWKIAELRRRRELFRQSQSEVHTWEEVKQHARGQREGYPATISKSPS